MRKLTVAIAGDGLAGTFTALRMAAAGYTVEWLVSPADESGKSASYAAAGLFNIYTGRNPVLTRMGIEMRDEVRNFFQTEPGIFFRDTYEEIPVYRPLMEPVFPEPQEFLTFQIESIPDVVNPYGGVWVNLVGRIMVPAFLDAAKAYLSELPNVNIYSQILTDRNLNAEHQTFRVISGTIKYDELIFCEGLKAEQNLFWRPYIYLKSLKGQMIRIKSDKKLPFVYINSEGFLIPEENDIWMVGSTYENFFDEPGITPEGAEKLKNVFTSAFLSSPEKVEIIEHWAGIRPATPDQKPILGRHPFFSHLWIFNGLGTKGVLHGCLGSLFLFNAISRRAELPSDWRPDRWKNRKKYLTSDEAEPENLTLTDENDF